MILKQVIHYTDTNSVEATWVDENDEVAKCHSYADVQMQMLRDDLGDDVSNYETLIAAVESNITQTEPEPTVFDDPIPSVSPWQIRKALNQLGLRDAVEAAVEAADQTTKDAWQYSTIFFRDNPLSIAIGYALGKTDKELDEVFLLAATL